MAEEINITIDDFHNCNWRHAIEEAKQKKYSYVLMFEHLHSYANVASEEGKQAEEKILLLLARACSMIFQSSSLNEPFGPLIDMGGERSTIPDDFKDDDIIFFSKIVPHIDDIKLKARISDIIWLLQKPRDPQFALMAIDNYQAVPISKESWNLDTRKCLDRAIQLCLMLGSVAGDRLFKIESLLIETLKKSSVEDIFLVYWINNLLVKHKLGKKEQYSITIKLEEIAISLEESDDLKGAIDYFNAASQVYKKLANNEKCSEMIARCAECWVKKAIERQSSNTPSQMVVAMFYEDAIQKYREIPREFRDTYNVDKRVHELRTQMNHAGEKSVSEMHPIDIPIDNKEIIERAERAVKAVKGKPFAEAMYYFANIYQRVKVEKIKEDSKELAGNNPLRLLVPQINRSHDGRIIAKRSGASLSEGNQDDIVWAEMVQNYTVEIRFAVLCAICPALEVIRQEHRLQEADFHLLVARAPLVPPERIQLFAKALYKGYDNDFICSIYLLVPQIEHLIRYHLKQNGEKTTNMDSKGIENENGLNTLMENAKIDDIIGKDLSFEIKALFCDPFGPNLRNELAHGLLDYDKSEGLYSVYAWWIVFHLIFSSFISQETQTQSEKNTEENA